MKTNKLDLLAIQNFEKNYKEIFTKENEIIQSKLNNKLNKNLIVVDNFLEEINFTIERLDNGKILKNLKMEYKK